MSSVKSVRFTSKRLRFSVVYSKIEEIGMDTKILEVKWVCTHCQREVPRWVNNQDDKTSHFRVQCIYCGNTMSRKIVVRPIASKSVVETSTQISQNIR
jgi:DNA-directed RNA polymerase subunit RPC12/RpoP